MAHLPADGEDENYYDMITISPSTVEFSEFAQAMPPDSRTYTNSGVGSTRLTEADYTQFLRQPQYFPTQKYSSAQSPCFTRNIHHQDIPFDPVMFANPNQTTKIESPDLLSPTSLGPGYRSQNSEFLSTQSIYSDAPSNANSVFHDAASHFSASAEAPSGYFEASAQPPDTFSQEIGLGESISTTNLHDMAHASNPFYGENDFSNSGQDSQRFYAPELQTNNTGLQLSNDFALNQENWRFDLTQQAQTSPFPQAQNHFGGSNRLTEDNLSSYNGKLEGDDAQVTISIHRAPEQVAAHTPSLFSNSSHTSSPNKSHAQMGNQLQPPGQMQRSRSPSLSLNPPSPSQSYNHLSSPALSANLPSPGESNFSDAEAESYLRPEDFNTMKRGRQSAHHLKVRSQSHSRSRSRSRSGSVVSGAESYAEDSDIEGSDNYDDSEAARSSREKMLELASSASVSKRTQIHPSSYACHLCEKKFTRPYNLKSHLRTHTDDRPFICNICGKAFARQHDRKRHEELHSGEKKYQCRGLLRDGTPFGCGRKFARADALRRHFQTESGRECIKLLVEEDAREQSTIALNSGIQLPDGEFMNPNAPDVPTVSVSPPQ
ncbi:hypothetical protein OXX69_009053 [Metschnikowia pulcherrima]